MMSKSTQKLVALTIAFAAGLVVVAASGLLTVESIAASRRLPQDKARVDELTSQARTDATYSAIVHSEQERQTDASLERQATKDALAPLLVVAAALLMASCKWLIALRGRPIPLPSSLVQLSVSLDAERPECSCESAAGSPNGAAAQEHVDLSFVEETVAREGRAVQAAIPILQAIQAHYRYLPGAALQRVRELTDITAARLVGVASFYTQFRRKPVGRHLIKVCHGTACHVAGAPRITDELRRHLRIDPGEDTDPTREFTIEQVACMGCCTLAPVAQIDDATHGHLRSTSALELLAHCREPKTNGESRKPAPDRAVAGDAVGEIRIGLGSCCVANGSGQVAEALHDALARGGVNPVVKRVGCVGMCHQTPLVEIDALGQTARYARVQPENATAIVRRHFRPHGLTRRLRTALSNTIDHLFDGKLQRVAADHAIELRDPPVAAFLGRQKHIATEHCGDIDPTDLDEYLRHGGFEALRRCAGNLMPVEVIGQVEASGLRGRGGAGFPTAVKWRKVRQAAAGRAADQPLVICNGDEGDPGAFMDRMLMESYPYRIIEGLAIAAHAVGATAGIFYIRREYPLAVERVREAIKRCEERGLLGGEACETEDETEDSRPENPPPDRVAPGVAPASRRWDCRQGRRPLHLRIVTGAGAFVCGEETALIASVEGRRGIPSLRPPYPAERGLGGRPTLVNNVETYAVVPWILRHGPEAFASLGTETSKGTKVFALAGKVKRGGLIEVPMGITIREIVEEIGGGAKDEERPFGVQPHRFKAVQIGGPSGGCVPAELADTPVDFEALARVGAIMGSGGLVVLDETDCMVDIARYFLTFTQSQSCGQCTPCRIGTRRMLEILERLCEGEGQRGDLEKLEDLAHVVHRGSLCGLGQTAPNPAVTTLRYFRDEYEAHLEGRCPAGRCKALITYSVTDACTGCTLCAQHCAADAIAIKPYEKHEIDQEKCTCCDACRVSCPEDAIEIT